MNRNLRGGAYLAGLWRQMLLEGLLWHLEPRRDHLRPRPAWRAPSWSWAAVDAPRGITYVHPGTSVFAPAFQGRILEARTVPAGPDAHGAVVSGFIRMEAALGEAYLRYPCQRCHRGAGAGGWLRRTALFTRNGSNAADTCGLRAGALELPPDVTISVYFDCLFWPGFEAGGRAFDPGDGSTGGCNFVKVFLLYISRFTSARVRDGLRQAFFLVLRELVPGSERYERVGLAVAVFETTQEEVEAWFDSSWSTHLGEEKVITLE